MIVCLALLAKVFGVFLDLFEGSVIRRPVNKILMCWLDH